MIPFIKPINQLKKLKQEKYFNTWLMRILINNCITYINKRKRLIFFRKNIDIIEKHESTDNREGLLDLYKAIDTLEDKFKMIIILRYFNDLTVPQIADIMDYPIGTVKTYIHKALKQLRIELEV